MIDSAFAAAAVNVGATAYAADAAVVNLLQCLLQSSLVLLQIATVPF